MIEKRTFDLTDVRVAPKADADEAKTGDRMTGHAIVFNSDSVDLGGFIERVSPTALTRSLTEVTDGTRNVFALWSHDTSQPLGSTRAGKLVLTQDERGLAFDLSTARFTPAQLDAARDGELRMSFGFQVRADAWEERDDGILIRTLLDVDLFEVSPVISPAYPDTTAAVRSMQTWRNASTFDVTAVRTRLLKRILEARLK